MSTSVPISDQQWRMRSACRGRELAQFFAAEGERHVAARLREARAKSLCEGCPVRPECAAQALATQEPYGVWGGFTRQERIRLLVLGWTDLMDRREARVDVDELERRLAAASVRPPQPRR